MKKNKNKTAVTIKWVSLLEATANSGTYLAIE